MSHKSIISGMGEPVQAIRVMNEKWLLLVMVGIKIILSFGKDYVKLAWEFTGKSGQENWDFWLRRNLKWLKRQKHCVHIEVLCNLESHCWKVRAGVSGFLTFIFFDMTEITIMQTIFLVLNTKKTCIWKSSVFQKLLLEKWCFHFKSRQAICTLVQKDCVNQRYIRSSTMSLTTLILCQIVLKYMC